MPQVPYTPYPNVGPSEQGQPEVRVSTPGEAFGTNVARAIEGLGGATSQVGNELFGRAVALQELKNETEAKEMDAKYMIDAGTLHEQFLANKGLNAGPEALEEHKKALNDMRQQYRSSLSNDQARRYFDASSLGFMGRNIFSAAGHSAQQMKVSAVNASNARIGAQADYIEHNPEDTEFTRQVLQGIDREADTRADIEGWTDAEKEDFVKKAKSHVILKNIEGMSKNKPFLAKDLFDANKNNLYKDDFVRAQGIVEDRVISSGTRAIENEVLQPLRTNPDSEETLGETLNRAEKLARTKSEDPRFIEEMRSRVTAGYNNIKAIRRSSDNQIFNRVDAAVLGLHEGNIPVNKDELFKLDPSLQDDWSKMSPHAQNRAEHLLNGAARKGEHVDARVSYNEVLRIKGIASEGSEGVQQFLEMPLGDNKKLTLSDYKQLMKLREQYTNSPNADPRVTQAFRWLQDTHGTEMEALKVWSRDKNDPDGYYRFRGGLQQALELFQEEYKRPARPKEVSDIIWPMINQTVMQKEKGWLWGTNDKEYKLFQAPIPADFDKEAYIKHEMDRSGTRPTEDQILRNLTRARLEELSKMGHNSKGDKE